MGYHQAGFTEIVGVDINPQPNYPFEFIQADVFEHLYETLDMDFDLIHASPPCQRYAAVTRWRGKAEDHPDLVGPTRSILQDIGIPYVIENVREAELPDPLILCGSQFGLKVRRHRHFESDWMPPALLPSHSHVGLLPFEHKQERAYADAMGCEWMTTKEGREAIPPAYTKYIGGQFMAQQGGHDAPTT